MRGGLHRVCEPLDDLRLDHQPVHHDLDVVFFVFVQLDLLVQVIKAAVGPDAGKAAPAGVFKDLLIFALPPPDHRRENGDAGALGQGHQLVDDLIHRLLADLPAALGAVGNADPRPEQAEIVVDLRNGAHSGAGVFGGGLLVDGDGGGETLDGVHIGLLHLAEKHPGIAGERLHIPPLALGIDGVEGKAALAGAGDAGDHR